MAQGSAALPLLGAVKTGSPNSDLALRGLILLAQFHGISADESQLAHQFGRTGEVFDETTLLLAAKQLGLKAKIIQQPAERIAMAALPALALLPDGGHFIVARVNDDTVLIHDLVQQRARSLSRTEFDELYTGRLLQVTSRASVLGQLAKFDFRWFVPAVVKYRKLLIEVLVVSFFIQMFALVTPLFYQVVMDKVLVHHSITTLEVIAVGLVSIAIFDVVLSGLRAYVFFPYHEQDRCRAGREIVPAYPGSAAQLFRVATGRRYHRPRSRTGEHPQLPHWTGADVGIGSVVHRRLPRGNVLLQRLADLDRGHFLAGVRLVVGLDHARAAQAPGREIRPRRR